MDDMLKIDSVINFYNQKHFELEQFLVAVQTFFSKNPILNSVQDPVVHSVKSRFKNPDHLRDKIKRKKSDGIVIDQDNLFEEINDLIGVRVLHIYQDQFITIHNEIMKKVDSGDWVFFEDPKAYTWDPESTIKYENLGISPELKETFYTSVHYVIKPNENNPLCCEIQVRTLFEEVWGEIDHSINYPHPTDDFSCKEQLRVLSKLVSTGTRLADSIFRTYSFNNQKKLDNVKED